MATIPINDHLREEEESEDNEITLDSIRNSKTINLSIRASYTRWAPREAFRELVQNWRDGIIKAWDLAEKDFHVIKKTKDSDTEIVYKALRRGADEKNCLGYIRYKGRNGEGTIDMTNRSATLQPWHLDLGGTSKSGDDHQAGAHGEGLKLALLVLMRGRQNHSVRCRSGGFNWYFNFTTRGRLVARLYRMAPEAIQEAKDQAQRLDEAIQEAKDQAQRLDEAQQLDQSPETLLPFGSDPELDVQFVIGETDMKTKARDEGGAEVERRAVKQEDFEAWTKAALFLQVPDETNISTAYGDLLTDPGLCGHIYLKGLLLCESVPTRSASITNKPLKFGYNFAFGHTNRERQSVASADEEARAILAIWSKALEAKRDLVSKLSDMLNTAEPQYADIAGAKRFMNLATAGQLKKYLVGSEFAGKWYYCSKDKIKNPRLDHIIQGLGCEGVQLTDLYWAILRRHNLIRTAEEEEHQRFTTAPPVAAAELETAFAQSVHRLLRACVHACPMTNGIAIQFVQAGQLHLQLFYSEAERLFRVHERWLSIDGAIEELGLPNDLLHVDAVFHTVRRLFADAVEQLPCELFVEDGSRTAESGREREVSRANHRLLNYQRVEKLDVEEIGSNRKLLLTWKVDTQLNVDTRVEIQCHSASRCLHLRESLLTAEDARADKLMCMGFRDGNDLEQRFCNEELSDSQFPACRSHECNYSEGRHYEEDLEAGEEYFFALRMPAKEDSFVALSSVIGVAHPAPLPSRPRSSPPSQVYRHGPRRSVPGGPPPELLSPQESGSADISSAETSDLVSNVTVSTFRGVSPSPEPVVNGSRPPIGEALGANRPTVVTAPAPATATVPAGTFTLGLRLETLDFLKIDGERWYEARNAENVQAVIGILRGEKSLPEETRKRPRID